MQQSVFSFIVCLFATFTLQASNFPIGYVEPVVPDYAFSCNAPAPKNFKAKGIGTTTVKLTWSYEPEAVGGYRIRTYQASDNVLVNTSYSSQDILDVVISGLKSGTGYYSVINSICEGNENSPIHGVDPFNTLIVDLVAVGYQGVNSPAICSIAGSNQSCYFSNEMDLRNHFKIKRNSITTVFSVTFLEKIENGEPVRKVWVETPYENSNSYDFYCTTLNNGIEEQDCKINTSVQVYLFDVPFAEFSILGGEEYTATLFGSIQNCSGCKIEYLGGTFENGLQAPPTTYEGQRTGLPNTPDFAGVMPNPFNDRLQVWVDDPSVESVHCQLFNVNGQKVLDQQFQGAQETYDLITENLANGFYLLRVEANGLVQTLRVIKAE